MSLPNMVDTFNLDNSNFNYISLTLNEFSQVYNDSVILDLDFQDTQIFSGLTTLDSKVNLFSFLDLSEAIELSKIKNEVDELVKVFPSLEDSIEVLDL